MSNKELWLVGKNIDYELGSWEFQGIYSSKKESIERCEDENWWIAKIKVNEFIPTEKTDFEYFMYPIQ